MLTADNKAWSLKSLGFLVCCGSVFGGCSEYRVQRAAQDPSSRLSSHQGAQATVCVFRAHGLGTSVVAPVTDNGVVVGATEGSSYFCYPAEPGRHELRVSDAPAVSLDVVAGKGYYLVHDLNVAQDSLFSITQESAHELSAWCDELELARAPEAVAVLERGAVARAEPMLEGTPVRVVQRMNVQQPEPELAPTPADPAAMEGALAAERRPSERAND